MREQQQEQQQYKKTQNYIKQVSSKHSEILCHYCLVNVNTLRMGFQWLKIDICIQFSESFRKKAQTPFAKCIIRSLFSASLHCPVRKIRDQFFQGPGLGLGPVCK